MLDTDGRHATIQEFRDAFEFDHLPEGLPQGVARLYHDTAAGLLILLTDGPALIRAIHDLWRSKNEAVLFAVRTAAGAPAGERPFIYPPVRRPGPIGALGRPWQGSPEQLAQIKDGGPIDRPEPRKYVDPVTGDDVEWPDHDEDDPDVSDGRHTLDDDRSKPTGYYGGLPVDRESMIGLDDNSFDRRD